MRLLATAAGAASAALALAAGGATAAKEFTILPYADIVRELKELAREHRDLINLDTAEALYGQKPLKGCGRRKTPCHVYIAHITNHATAAEDPARPQVFFSGELHGNERVGPTATLEFARFLLTNYHTNPWVKNLVDTRSITIVPTANALGYHRFTREELGIDVNRDFPIDDPISCMQSRAARVLNEIFRANLFQLAITFHAGTEMVTFTWGTITALSRSRRKSPDDVSQLMLSSAMSAFAGKAEGRYYPFGRMNDIIYPVRGGMEDWAYASSWPFSGHGHEPCKQSSYAPERTTYEPHELRVLNFLVETSHAKTPRQSTLGTDEDLLNPAGAGEGHIPRNVRLMLFLTELVQPYVKIVEADATSGLVTWEVGGALNVDKTYVEAEYEDLRTRQVKSKSMRARKGATRWNGGGVFSRNGRLRTESEAGQRVQLDEDIMHRGHFPFIGAFNTKLQLPTKSSLRRIQVFATVDSDWANNPGAWPALSPQSHFVNARTNADYTVSHNGHEIHGNVLWASDPLCFSEDGDSEPCGE